MEIAALIQFILCVFLLCGEDGVLSQVLFTGKVKSPAQVEVRWDTMESGATA